MEMRDSSSNLAFLYFITFTEREYYEKKGI